MSPPLAPESAWARIAEELSPLAAETVARPEAGGRVLAGELVATTDVPAADVSAMDGYAVAAAVTAGDRRVVTATIAAGDPPGYELPAGSAARIMTGAPVPPTSVSVIPVEMTDNGDERVIFHHTLERGANIRRRGEVVRNGDVLLARGHLVTPGALSLIATHGYRELAVHPRPTVATLATGDEVVPADCDLRPGKLRDSHTDFLHAAGRDLALHFTALGIAPDSSRDLLEHLRRGLAYDVLLVSGGVSMGTFDLVEPMLESLGCRPLFDAVAIQPGKPLVVARHAGGWVFGLPGNPASVMVGYWLFVRPLLRRLQGLRDGFWHGALGATLSADLVGAKDRDRFLAAEVATRGGSIEVRPVTPKGSHDLMAFARGRALVRVRPGSPPASAGERCEILPLSDWPLADASA